MTERKWNVEEGVIHTITACVPRDECVETWQFFHETMLEFFAHRQIPYELNMTNYYGEFDRGDTAQHEGAKPMKPSVDVHTVGGVTIFVCEDVPGAEEAVAEERKKRQPLAAELGDMFNSDVAEAFEASLRSDDLEGAKTLGAELLRRFNQQTKPWHKRKP
jgi:hypothetical protein